MKSFIGVKTVVSVDNCFNNVCNSFNFETIFSYVYRDTWLAEEQSGRVEGKESESVVVTATKNEFISSNIVDVFLNPCHLGAVVFNCPL